MVFSILIGCDKNDLLTTEQFYLDSIPTWFNTCKVAGNTTGGKLLSQEHKDNIAKSQEGVNNPFYGKSHTEEYIRI